MLRRRRARTSLVDYSKSIIIPGAPIDEEDPDCWLFRPIETEVARHHIVTMEAIQRTIERPYGRLMIFEPPGSAKSTFASVVAPTWAMGKFPDYEVLMASYASGPIERHSKRARQICTSPEYRSIWKAELIQGSQAAKQWGLTNGSTLFAAGLMGGITSRRCDLGIIDDPVAGRAEAASETVRRSTREAYEDDFMSRIKPGAPIILIQTRWAPEDLAGGILPESWSGESGMIECRDGQIWEVLCLPAECESTNDPCGRAIGEYLWPEWFTEQHWKIFKKNPRTWNALYQQRPRATEGAFFTQDQFLIDGKPVESVQHIDTVFAVIDSAMKTGKRRDGLGVVFYGFSRLQPLPLVILDYELTQMNAASLIDWVPSVFTKLELLARSTKARMGVSGVWIEDKSSGTVLLQQLAKKQPEHPDWKVHAIDSKLTSMGKVERGLNASPYVEAGQVKISRHAYDKTVEYHQSRKNHLLTQILDFDPGVEDMGEDDLFDGFCYGVMLALGNQKGF
jgi:hypothetical protein